MIPRKILAKLRKAKTPVKPERTLAVVEGELKVAREETRELEKSEPPYNRENPGASWDAYSKHMRPAWDKQQKLDRELRLLMIPEFTRDVEEGDHVMKLKDFILHVKHGMFIDYDGFGHYVRDGKVSNIDIYPSDIDYDSIRDDFDMIVWFNK